jgi:catechol 2,3-dioxygenase-like lactoylglutathione lyase family enzyme
MLYHAIDSVYLAARDLDAACRPYERLGLRLSPPAAGRRTLHVGGPTNLFAVHFLADADPGSLFAAPLRQAIDTGRSLFAVALRVADLDETTAALAGRGLRVTRGRDGDADLGWLPLHGQTGVDRVLVRHDRPVQERHAAAVRAGLLEHTFPLKRLDHLAVVTHDLGVLTRFWADVLGVPVAGEVTTPTMVIRQLRIGDAVLELLGPAAADSPLRQRQPGLVGMASWEVEQLEAAVAKARTAGFTVTDPAAGPLPGTRIATVQGAELAGVNMQLLAYA